MEMRQFLSFLERMQRRFDGKNDRDPLAIRVVKGRSGRFACRLGGLKDSRVVRINQSIDQSCCTLAFK